MTQVAAGWSVPAQVTQRLDSAGLSSPVAPLGAWVSSQRGSWVPRGSALRGSG